MLKRKDRNLLANHVNQISRLCRGSGPLTTRVLIYRCVPLQPSYVGCCLTYVFSVFFLYLFPQAEARLAAKRAARAEAREIRMKELERQQKEVQVKKHSFILNCKYKTHHMDNCKGRDWVLILCLYPCLCSNITFKFVTLCLIMHFPVQQKDFCSIVTLLAVWA